MSEDEWSDEPEDWQSDNEIEDQLPSLVRGMSYAVISFKEIARKQAQAIETVSDQLGLTHSQAGALLTRYDWNPFLVCQKVMDGRGVEDILMSRSRSIIADAGGYVCGMCYGDYPCTEMRGLECGHYFCTDCYTNYLEDSVLSRGLEAIFTTCPDSVCPSIVGEDLFKALLSKPLFEKYCHLVVRSYVERRSTVKWCPAPGCEFAVEYPKERSRIIVCHCGFSWCFKCGADAHQPLSCDDLAKWRLKDTSNAEGTNEDWLLVNTKKCPGCQKPIQKNQGCMHMTCTCGHQFCWLCLGAWSQHGSDTGGVYACNRFTAMRDAGDLRDEERDRFIAEQSLKRYEHYSSRFIDHKKAIGFAKKKQEKLKASVLNMVATLKTTNPAEFDTFIEASNLILEARTGLAYSYPLGYFMTSPAKLSFYEFLQGELEHSLDILDQKTDIKLEGYLTSSPSGGLMIKDNFYADRSQLMSLVSVVRTHFSKSIKEMELGFPEIGDVVGEEAKRIEMQILTALGASSTTAWKCSLCTFSNEPSVTECAACHSAKPAF
jgi:ariadne-1